MRFVLAIIVLFGVVASDVTEKVDISTVVTEIDPVVLQPTTSSTETNKQSQETTEPAATGQKSLDKKDPNEKITDIEVASKESKVDRSQQKREVYEMSVEYDQSGEQMMENDEILPMGKEIPVPPIADERLMRLQSSQGIATSFNDKAVPYLPKQMPIFIEKKVAYPVEKIVTVPVKVPVEIPRPYPVTVEKKIPYYIEKPVPYPVKVPIEKPYPVPVPYKVFVEKPYPIPVENKTPYPFPASNYYQQENGYQKDVTSFQQFQAQQKDASPFHRYREQALYQESFPKHARYPQVVSEHYDHHLPSYYGQFGSYYPIGKFNANGKLRSEFIADAHNKDKLLAIKHHQLENQRHVLGGPFHKIVAAHYGEDPTGEEQNSSPILPSADVSADGFRNGPNYGIEKNIFHYPYYQGKGPMGIYGRPYGLYYGNYRTKPQENSPLVLESINKRPIMHADKLNHQIEHEINREFQQSIKTREIALHIERKHQLERDLLKAKTVQHAIEHQLEHLKQHEIVSHNMERKQQLQHELAAAQKAQREIEHKFHRDIVAVRQEEHAIVHKLAEVQTEEERIKHNSHHELERHNPLNKYVHPMKAHLPDHIAHIVPRKIEEHLHHVEHDEIIPHTIYEKSDDHRIIDHKKTEGILGSQIGIRLIPDAHKIHDEEETHKHHKTVHDILAHHEHEAEASKHKAIHEDIAHQNHAIEAVIHEEAAKHNQAVHDIIAHNDHELHKALHHLEVHHGHKLETVIHDKLPNHEHGLHDAIHNEHKKLAKPVHPLNKHDLVGITDQLNSALGSDGSKIVTGVSNIDTVKHVVLVHENPEESVKAPQISLVTVEDTSAQNDKITFHDEENHVADHS